MVGRELRDVERLDGLPDLVRQNDDFVVAFPGPVAEWRDALRLQEQAVAVKRLFDAQSELACTAHAHIGRAVTPEHPHRVTALGLGVVAREICLLEERDPGAIACGTDGDAETRSGVPRLS